MNLSDKVISWTQTEFKQRGLTDAVIGISGGKDSTVVTAILVKALGTDHVHGVLLPNGEQKDINDSYEVLNFLKIHQFFNINIQDMVNETLRCIEKVGIMYSNSAKINVSPRIRMTTLYAIAASINRACVVGTGNKAEHFVGYYTKWGDGACDINPIQDLWVDEVIQVGLELGLPKHLLVKAPSDGLCGKTDEEFLGFSYDDVQKFAETGSCGNSIKDRLITIKHNSASHKECPIPFYVNI